MTLKSINPATGELLGEFKTLTQEQLDTRVQMAGLQFPDWGHRTSLEKRIGFIEKIADKLEEKKEELAKIMTLEMGKPILESIAEVEKSAHACRFYAENAPEFLADEKIETEARRSYISYHPLGVILLIMPWNFPLWQVIRAAAPTLIAGNTVVLKHASNVPQTSAMIERIFREAGLPANTFINLPIKAAQVESVISNFYVQALSFTGSEAAGREVAACAGKNLKKVVLELGGSDAFIVLNEASLRKAIDGAISSRFQNAGQSCIAAKRFIVESSIYNRFIDMFKEAVETRLVMGDPLEETTNIGPLARPEFAEELHKQVTESISQGAKLITGGEILENGFYKPTILADVTSDMPVFAEETFGPVAAISKALEPAYAQGIANNSRFGLGASVWTDDISTGETIARMLQAGSCFVNATTHSDPRLPFGGIKNSGYGRELSSHGIREFTNIKTVYVSR